METPSYDLTSGPSDSSLAAVNSLQNPQLAESRVSSVLEKPALDQDDGQTRIVVDNGSMTKACPPWFRGNLAMGEHKTIHVVDLQQRPVNNYGKRSTPLFIVALSAWRVWRARC